MISVVTFYLEYLRDNEPRFTLLQRIVFLQVRVQVTALAVIQHGAKTVLVNFEHVEQLHDARVNETLVDVVLATRVLGVVLLLALGPVRVQLMNFTPDVA